MNEKRLRAVLREKPRLEKKETNHAAWPSIGHVLGTCSTLPAFPTHLPPSDTSALSLRSPSGLARPPEVHKRDRGIFRIAGASLRNSLPFAYLRFQRDASLRSSERRTRTRSSSFINYPTPVLSGFLPTTNTSSRLFDDPSYASQKGMDPAWRRFVTFSTLRDLVLLSR